MHSARIDIIIGFLCACILLAIFIMFSPLFPFTASFYPQRPLPRYWLRDVDGRVAVFESPSPFAHPIAVHDIYVNLLPEVDALRLKAGWLIYGDEALARTLEDLGL